MTRLAPPGLAALLLVSSADAQVTHHDPTRAWQGLHLDINLLEKVNPEINPKARVLDMDGNLVHTWQDPVPGWGFAELVKPVAGGNLLGMVYERASAAAGQSIHKAMVELDWNGAVVWAYDPTPLGFLVHHDFERLPNGNTLLLAQRSESHPSLHPGMILNEYLLEVTPGGAIVWSWDAASHASEFPVGPEGWAYLFNFPANPAAAIFHTNSIQSLPPNKWEASDPRFKAGNVLLSFRETNLTLLIGRATGEVVWSYAQAIGQHHARMIPNGFPGAGNILLFDNGGSSGAPPIERGYSRVVEIRPPGKKTVWSYETPPTPGGHPRVGGPGGPGGLTVTATVNPFFFSDKMGGCQRLPNGNTLITESTTGRIFEVTKRGQIVWQFEKVVGEKVYRAYRVPVAWPAGPLSFPW